MALTNNGPQVDGPRLHNGLLYLLAGVTWIRFESRIPLGYGKSLYIAQDTASRAHPVRMAGPSFFTEETGALFLRMLC